MKILFAFGSLLAFSCIQADTVDNHYYPQNEKQEAKTFADKTPIQQEPTKWKSNELAASDPETSLEALIEIEKDSNPFTQQALLTNPRYIQLKDNEERIQLLKNRKIFDSKMDELKNKFTLTNTKLLRTMYIFELNDKNDNLNLKEMHRKFSDLKKDYNIKFSEDKKILEATFGVIKRQLEDRMIKHETEFNDRKNRFQEQLKKYVETEHIALTARIDKLLTETKLNQESIIQVQQYLKTIESEIYDITTSKLDIELTESLNPELFVIKELYDQYISKIEMNLNKVIEKKHRILFEIETASIKKSEADKYVKMANMNLDLKTKLLNKQEELEIEIVKENYRKQRAQTQMDYEKSINDKKLEINEHNLVISNNMFTYSSLASENADVVSDLSEFRKIVGSLSDSKALIFKKIKGTEMIVNADSADILKRLAVAKNKGTDMATLHELTTSHFWSIREAVASNLNTSFDDLKTLTQDQNLFVSLAAKKTIETKEGNLSAKRMLELEYEKNKY